VGLNLVQVQLYELWADVKHEGQALWVWVVIDPQARLILVLSLSDRTQRAAYQVVHELKARLALVCISVFSTDGLKAYFYALTSHFGKGLVVEGKKNPIWVLPDD
jgi:IS1 family transposase